MPKYLTTEADVNFPVPGMHQLIAQLHALYDGQRPVTTAELARAFQLVEGAIVPVLRRVEQSQLVRKVGHTGWIPL